MSKTSHPRMSEMRSTRRLIAEGYTARKIAEMTGQTIEQVNEHFKRPVATRSYGKTSDQMTARLEADERFAREMGVRVTYDEIERARRWG